jgi:hypothetical protein
MRAVASLLRVLLVQKDDGKQLSISNQLLRFPVSHGHERLHDDVSPYVLLLGTIALDCNTGSGWHCFLSVTCFSRRRALIGRAHRSPAAGTLIHNTS